MAQVHDVQPAGGIGHGEQVAVGRNVDALEASAEERVGINKSFNTLAGTISFTFKAVRSDSEVTNLYFFVVPMQETGPGRKGLIEVGADRQNDPRNYTSPYRVRSYVKPQFIGDGRWHADQETVWDLTTDSFRTLGWTSADAAGLPILPGLVRPDAALPVAQGGAGGGDHRPRGWRHGGDAEHQPARSDDAR